QRRPSALSRFYRLDDLQTDMFIREGAHIWIGRSDAQKTLHFLQGRLALANTVEGARHHGLHSSLFGLAPDRLSCISSCDQGFNLRTIFKNFKNRHSSPVTGAGAFFA